MARLLVIAYYYPPWGGAGVQRTLKFTKYLPEFGWEPVVLTVKPNYAHLQDISLQNDLPNNLSVYRTRAFLMPARMPWRMRSFIARWIMLVDEQLGWYPFAVKQAESIISRGNIHAIYTTSAPFTDHLIGYRLAKRTGLPWIADFRDPWIGNFSYQFPTRFHESLSLRLERLVAKHARRLIVVSEPMRQAILSRHSDLKPERVVTIPNGFDEGDFQAIRSHDYDTNRMSVVYTGSFYSQVHTPRPFLQPLKSVVENNRIPRRNIQVFLVGNIGKGAQNMVNDMGLEDIVHATGYLPHRESLSYLLGADVLLYIMSGGAGSEAVYTGKLFEYLAARKPILAITPPGAAADLINRSRAGVILDPQDVAGISDQLVELFRRWQKSDLNIHPDEEVISNFDRRKLTQRLADTLNLVAES